MGSTSQFAIPYPDAGATNNVPGQMKSLADAVDAAIPVLESNDSHIAASHVGDVGDAGVAVLAARADHVHDREAEAAAWTAFTPSVHGSTANPTITPVSDANAYQVIGKTMNLRLAFQLNTLGSGNYTVTVPGGHSAHQTFVPALAFDLTTRAGSAIQVFISGTTISLYVIGNGNPLGSANTVANEVIAISATFEISS